MPSLGSSKENRSLGDIMNKDNGTWRSYLITILISVLLTGGTSWFAFGSRAVSSDEVEKLIDARIVSREDVKMLIATQAPYIQDRQLILDRMERIDTIDGRLQNIEIQLAILVKAVPSPSP